MLVVPTKPTKDQRRRFWKTHRCQSRFMKISKTGENNFKIVFHPYRRNDVNFKINETAQTIEFGDDVVHYQSLIKKQNSNLSVTDRICLIKMCDCGSSWRPGKFGGRCSRHELYGELIYEFVSDTPISKKWFLTTNDYSKFLHFIDEWSLPVKYLHIILCNCGADPMIVEYLFGSLLIYR